MHRETTLVPPPITYIDMRQIRIQLNLHVFILAIATLLFACLSLGIYFIGWSPNWPKKIVIASGYEKGVYHKLGIGLADAINKSRKTKVASTVNSNGSVDNIELIKSGAADIGFIQSDTEGSNEIRSVATLYDEVIHIIVRSNNNVDSGYHSLEDKKVAVGPKGSGTYFVAQKFMDHYNVNFELSLIPVANLQQAFTQGEIDAAILITAINSPITRTLLTSGGYTLLSLDRKDSQGDETLALSQVFPHYSPAKIFPRVYGDYPKDTIHTLAVKATLVVNKNLPNNVVRDITETLFSNRANLTKKHGAIEQLREKWNASEVQYPFHQGAIDYYNRSKPLFVVQYSEALSFALSLVMLIFAGIAGFSAWLNKRAKNYVDLFYEKVQNINVEESSAMSKLDEALDGALKDLIDEKLEANASFQILQALVQQRMMKILLLDLEKNRTPPENTNSITDNQSL